MQTKPRATTTRYFAHIVRYSSTGQFISETDMEIDEASYNSEVVMPRGDGYIETTYKQLRTTISKVNSLYRFKVSLVWKQMPAKRSYDIIGIGYDPYVSVSGSLVFSQNSCVSTNCTSTSTRNSTSINTNGSGVSFKLPTSTSITTLSSYLYFNITKTNSSDTITAMYAYGDYAHATSTITGGNAQGFYVNQAGIMIANSGGKCFMDWYLVDFDSYLFKYIVIIVFTILSVILLYVHDYLIKNKDIYNSMVYVISDKLITSDYTLYSPYYLSYEDIEVSIFDKDFTFTYSLLPSYKIYNGRDIENDFEILLTNKYSNLIGKKIPLFIEGDIYYFLVVGTYFNMNPFYDNHIYMKESSLSYLYSIYEPDYYNYTFIFDGYTDMNIDIDYLKENGYSTTILYTNTVERMDNYNVINDAIMLAVVNLMSAVVLFLYQFYTLE